MKINNQNKIIGVLGGMGPEATAKFYDLLIKLSQAKCGVVENDDFPEVIIDSVPVPDFVSDTGSKKAAEEMLVKRVEMLSKLPITFFCIACNTAHLIINSLERSTEISFISLVDETTKAVNELKIKKIGLLASPTTIKKGIYAKAFRRKGIEVVVPKKEEIEKLGKMIQKVIAGEKSRKDSKDLRQMADSLVANGSEAIILGCTELPLLFGKKDLLSVPVVGTLEVLARSCLEKYYAKMRGGEKR